MKFSRNWLADYVELPDSAEALAELLTGMGLTVDTLEEHGGDVLLDVEVTSNRPDCMSHLGLAREVAAARRVSLVRPDLALRPAVEAEKAEYASVTIDDSTGCPRYVAVGLRGVTVAPSPSWLTERLRAVGVRPINNVVDVTNYVLWEYGQPMHAFDLATLSGSRIVVRRGAAGERLTTLDGIERELDGDILVIADADRAVALAGIMGGQDTEVGDGTDTVLLESAHFSRELVRRAARRLGLHTDASHRFERGSDPEVCLEAALRAAELMVDLTGAEVETVAVDARAECFEPRRGTLDLESLNRFAGIEVPREVIEQGLAALGFELSAKNAADAASWEVLVPSWRRFDFELDEAGEVYPAYFYEEALRLFGFDRIPATVPAVRGPDAGASRSHRERERLRRFLSAAGFAETVTYPFRDAASDSMFPGLEKQGEPAVLANALSEQYEVMRRSLLPGLVVGAHFNLRRQAPIVRLFEIGHLFPGEEAAEVDAVAVVLGGEFERPWQRRQQMDLFDLKGVAEGLGARAGVELEFRRAELEGFVAGTSSEVVDAEGQRVGYMGQVDDPELVFPVYALELAVASVSRSEPPRVHPPSRFPGVGVDLTLTHPADLAWSEIERAICAEPPEELAEFGLKDRYEGDGVPAGAVNTTIFFHYVSPERSLTHAEVNERHLRLAVRLDELFGWRGETSKE